MAPGRAAGKRGGNCRGVFEERRSGLYRRQITYAGMAERWRPPVYHRDSGGCSGDAGNVEGTKSGL